MNHSKLNFTPKQGNPKELYIPTAISSGQSSLITIQYPKRTSKLNSVNNDKSGVQENHVIILSQ